MFKISTKVEKIPKNMKVKIEREQNGHKCFSYD